MINKDFFVIKRSGEKEKFNHQKINKVLKWACEGLEVDSQKISEHFQFNYTSDGITTVIINSTLVEAALDLITEDTPDYQYVAGRLLNYTLRKSVWGGSNPPRLIDVIKLNVKLGNYDKSLLEDYSVRDINKINEIIDHSRDLNFTHAGIRQMMDKYLVQNRKTKEIFETPQFAYVLVAMTLFSKESKNRLSWIKRAYDYYSTWKINLATPVIAGARTPLRSFASCALFAVGDSLDSIGTTDYLLKKASASRYGLGLDISRIRNLGAPIRHGDVLHTGVVPYLKSFESGIKSCHQNGIRGASGTVFINWWHAQVEDVLVLKNNALPDEKAVRFLDYCLVFSDLLIDRVKKKGKITLFNPHEVPELIDNFGLPGWDEMYLKREQDESIYRKEISALDLMTTYAKERLGTGRVYSMHVENCNRYSPFKNRVGQSNLCVAPETMLLTSDGYKPIYTLVGQLVEVWNGREWSNSPVVKTGNNQKLIKVVLGDGKTLDCTEYHKFYVRPDYDSNDRQIKEVRAYDLKPGDLLIPDGYKNNGDIYVDNVFDLGRYDDTYCVYEPIEHKVIFNGILTGNCLEVLQPTIPPEQWNDPNALTGVCILAGVNALYVQDNEFESVCEVVVRMLDNLISYQSYFDKSAENFATKYRSLAIGALNFAALLAERKTKYDWVDAPKIAAEFAEKLSYYCIKASINLAKERGSFEYFDKTKWSDGELPIDRYCKAVDKFIDPLKLDWESLRILLKEYGIRNSTLLGWMPVESSSIISSSTSGLEPIRSYIVSKTSKAGKVTVIAPNIKTNKEYYSLAFDLPVETMQYIYAAVNKFTCMSISANNYVNVAHYDNKQIPLSVVVKDTINFFELGGKTQYYFNTEDDSGESGCSSGACSI